MPLPSGLRCFFPLLLLIVHIQKDWSLACAAFFCQEQKIVQAGWGRLGCLICRHDKSINSSLSLAVLAERGCGVARRCDAFPSAVPNMEGKQKRRKERKKLMDESNQSNGWMEGGKEGKRKAKKETRDGLSVSCKVLPSPFK